MSISMTGLVMTRKNIWVDERRDRFFFLNYISENRQKKKKPSRIDFLWCRVEVIKVVASMHHDLYISGDL